MTGNSAGRLSGRKLRAWISFIAPFLRAIYPARVVRRSEEIPSARAQQQPTVECSSLCGQRERKVGRAIMGGGIGVEATCRYS